jgi:hypothetical protein
MILISHRGNTNGRVESLENNPSYVDLAISNEYDVEVDVWYLGGLLYLGHDKPQYVTDIKWFRDRLTKLWIHCKNIDSIMYFQECGYEFNYFWHQEDDITLTSKNNIWTFPGKKLTKRSIAVLPESVKDWELTECFGVCSDYIKNYKLI